MVRVKFIKSPVALLKLGYLSGQEANLEQRQADEAVELGLAEIIQEKKKPTKAKK